MVVSDGENEPETLQCVHHWLLGESDGGKAEGVCKHCSAVRTFSGGIPTDRAAWKDVPFVSQAMPLAFRFAKWREVEEEM